MEFVTIHDLSRALNIPARVVRYRLINLIADAKLNEGEDFRRDDFKDEQHFVFKINPISFMRATGLKPALSPPLDNHALTPDTKSVNEPRPVVNQPVNQPAPPVTERAAVDTKAGNPPIAKPDNSLEREMIDLLKDQINVKDGQLREQGEQMKDLNDLNVKLTGTMLQQNQKIENLLRLTGGKGSMAEVVNQTDNERDDAVTESVNQPTQAGYQTDTPKAA